jgi:uncharacterized protein (DUF2236 family)
MDAVPFLEPLRVELGGAVRKLLTGSARVPEHVARPRFDDGWFGPDSVAWQVHADIAMLVGGLRALIVQTMHPLAMAGVADHSDYRHDPWGRLHRTAEFLAATTYGDSVTAQAAIDRVAAVHRRVEGVAPDGRPYSARDPELVAYVHATEVDSFLRAVRRYGRTRLDAAAADRYVAEMAQIGERLGAVSPPRSRAELREYFESVRPELRATGQARDAVRFLLTPPVPTIGRPAYAVLAAAAVGLLPRYVRRALWLPSPALVHRTAVQPAATLVLGGMSWLLDAAPPRRQEPGPRPAPRQASSLEPASHP